MDILRQMTERRKEMGMVGTEIIEKSKPSRTPKPKPEKLTLREMRNRIIEEKPKAKVVKEYFQEVVNRLAVESDSDEEK
jgi:hypothetical protein